MKKIISILCFFGCTALNVSAQKTVFSFEKALVKQLKEISGIAYDDNFLWAIQDEPSPKFYKLNTQGDIVQEITMNNAAGKDVEAVTFDKDFVYVADIGDNKGTKPQHVIYKIKKADIGKGPTATVNAQTISFSYKDFKPAKQEAANNFDAEAIISYNDSLYVFTKRRGDLQTALYAIPKTPGSYTVLSKAVFDSKGLVTDASLNSSKNELTLVGYLPGHHHPFVWIMRNFGGSNFFAGEQKQFVLSSKKKQWQIEGVSYKDNNSLFLSCEETSDKPAALYLLNKSNLRNN